MGGAYLCGVVVLIQHPPLSPSAKGNTAEHPSQTTSRCVEGISNSTELLSSRLQGWMQGWITDMPGRWKPSECNWRKALHSPHRADNEQNEALLPLVPTKIRAIEKKKRKRNRKEMCTATVRLQNLLWLVAVFCFVFALSGLVCVGLYGYTQNLLGGWLCFVFAFVFLV